VSSLKKIYGTEYQITTAAVLDREQQDSYNLAIVCTDFGDDPQAAVEHIAVHVLDVNDHEPRFSHTSYVADLIENNYVGVVVLYVNATDADIGLNAEIVYSIEGLSSLTMSIVSLTIE